MKKLIVALFIAILCMVAPAVALDWDALPTDTQVMVYMNPTLGTYLALTIGEDTYPAWCVESDVDVIMHLYNADLTTTVGVNEEWNKINWILNHKGNANYLEVQTAIWKIRGQPMLPLYNFIYCFSFDARKLVRNADSGFIPTCGEIGAVLVVPNGNYYGRDVIIEVEMACPPTPTPTPTPTPGTPVPEFPTMMIPVFLVGSLMIVGSILKKE